MKKIPLTIIQIIYTQSPSMAYTMVLGEIDGLRRLPIVIGNAEAQAIGLELENLKAKRPLTHDLFHSFAVAFNITLTEIIINKFESGVFHSVIVCKQGDKIIEIDSRTSDAVALALRFKCPIYASEDVMNEAAVNLQDFENSKDDSEDNLDSPDEISSESEKENLEQELQYLTLGQLKELLQNAIRNEEFEKASLIRDEINRRKK